MQNSRPIQLVHLDIDHAYYEPFETNQEQVDFIKECYHNVFREQLDHHCALPLTICDSLVVPDFDNATMVILQVLDSSNTMILGSLPDSGHPCRQLTRLEVVTWAIETYRTELTETTKMHLDCGGNLILYTVFDKEFEVKSIVEKPWSSLGMLMTKQTFLDLFHESDDLEDKLDSALCLGFGVVFGRNQEQVETNKIYIEQGHLRSWRVFGSMAQADFTVSPFEDAKEVEVFLKHPPFTTAPVLVNWTQEIGDNSIRQYLKKPVNDLCFD